MSAAPPAPPASPTPVPPPPSAGPRPVPPSAEARSVPAFLASEGSLLVLSLVLAVMVWWVVRTMVDTTKTLDVNVEFVTPPDSHVFAEEHVQLKLAGKRGELEQVQSDLDARGGRVRLIVGPLAAGLSERSIRPGDDAYRLPFPPRLLEDPAKPQLPRGQVVRLQRQSVRVEPPPSAESPRSWPQGIRAEVTLLTTSIEVTAPAGAIDGPLTPDPVDLAAFGDAVAGLSAPVEVTLSFDGWRRGPPGTRPDDALVRRRAVVALPEVRATVRFVLWAKESLTNAVEIVIRRSHAVTVLRPPTGAAFIGTLEPEEAGQQVEATFTGEVRGSRELLDELRERPDAWRWVLRVRDEDLPKEGGASPQVTATLSLVAFESLAAPLAQGYVVFAPLSVQVEVRRLR